MTLKEIYQAIASLKKQKKRCYSSIGDEAVIEKKIKNLESKIKQKPNAFR